MRKIKQLNYYLIMLFLLFSTIGLAQKEASDIKISGNFKDKSMFLVFAVLEVDGQLKFEYKKEDIEGLTVTASFKKLPLDVAMAIILNNTDLAFEYKAPRTVVIIENTKKKQYEAAASKPQKFDFTLKGTIKDKDSGETLPFANIVVKGTNKGASTNVDGYFTIFNVPSDTSVLMVQYIGYRTKYFRLHPEMDKSNLVVEISNLTSQLAEVLVISEAEEQTMNASTGVSQISVSPMQLNYLPSFGEKDIFRSLQLLPGISGSNESSSGLYVRGGTPDQNLILFDGFTVYHVDHLFGFFSAFNANAVKDIQLYKGGFEAKYGGRLSSVVELTGKDGNTEKVNMGFGVSLLSVNTFLESPFAKGKGSFFVAGRRSFQSNFYNNLFTSFTEASQDAAGVTQPQGGGRFGQQQAQPNTYFYDLNAKVTYRPTKKDILSLSFYNGQDDLDNSRNFDNNSVGGRPGGGNTDLNFERTNTDLTKWGNWGASSKWSRRWNENFYTNAHLSYSQYFSERNRTNKTVVTRNDTTFTNNNGSYEYNNLQDVTLKIDNEWKLNSNNQMEFGLQSTFNNIEYEYTQNDTLSILSRLDKGMTNSIYLQDRHTFSDKLILKGGIRASHYSVTDEFYIEPRASFTYLATDKIKLKGAWGRYNQMATRVVREDIQQGSRDFWLLANGDNIPIGYAEHFIAGTSYETPTYLFDVEAYYKNLDGLTEYTTRFIPQGFGRDRTLEYEELFYTGTGTAKGIEFLAQKKKGKFTGWISYTLGEVLYDFEDFGSEPFYANQDQTHEAKIVANYKWKNWNFGATFIYATGKPYTAPTGYYQVELLDGTMADFYEISGKNAVRLPDYHRLDFSITNDFKLGNSNASIGASIFNVYNRNNVWYKEYEVIEGEMIETEVTLLNFTPSLFFNWQLR